MKVLSISTDRNIFKDGSPVYLRSLEYAKRMEEFHVVVFTKRGEKKKFLKVGNMYVYPTNSVTQWFYVKGALKLCKKIILENKFVKGDSVISTQDVFQTGYVGAKISNKFNFPLQVQVHNDYLSPEFSKLFLNIIRRFIASRVITKAQNIRVVNEIIKQSIVKKYKDLENRISVLPIFVDVEKIIRYEPKLHLHKLFPKWKFIIFMASRITQEKRFDVALKTLKKVVGQYEHVGLVIAGEGPMKESLKRMVKRLKLDNHVEFIGWQEDLISYYKTCNIFLLTSEHEGYGMTLIEAASSGAMIVTTKVGVAKTNLFVDEENSHICSVGDVECLANCIVGIIRDNQRRELFAQRIQNAVKNQSGTKEEYSDKYVGLLQNLLKK